MAALERLDDRVQSIAIIEDEPDARVLLRRILQHKRKYKIFEAPDGANGMALIRAERPDLVLLELELVGSRINELVRDIRAECPHATLIGMTNDAMPAWRPTADDHGVDYCVPLTPMGHTELVAIVNALQPEQSSTDLMQH